MVFKVTIPNFMHFGDETLRKLRDQLHEVAKWDWDRDENRALMLISEKLNPEKFERVKRVLEDAEVGYKVEDLSKQYLLVFTNAPEAYDYPYTVPLAGFAKPPEGIDLGGKEARMVAVQKERSDYQFGRYSSGLYGFRIAYKCSHCKDMGSVVNSNHIESWTSYCPKCS
jgi:hypothetical protein